MEIVKQVIITQMSIKLLNPSSGQKRQSECGTASTNLPFRQAGKNFTAHSVNKIETKTYIIYDLVKQMYT